MTSLPAKISPEPIIDTTVELKFSTVFPVGAIFGMVYSLFKDRYPTVEELPILQIPEGIRKNDPNFKYKPLHKLSNESFIIQIGYDVVSLHSKVPYVGWQKFLLEIKTFFNKINQLGLVYSPINFALRYVNFFEVNIFEHINLEILLINEPLHNHLTVIRTELQKEDYIQVVQIANNGTFKYGQHLKNGSLLDITIVMDKIENFFDRVEDIAKKAHNIEKELFWGLLKPEFRLSLNPQY